MPWANGPDARNSLFWRFLADVYPTLVCVLLRTGFRGGGHLWIDWDELKNPPSLNWFQGEFGEKNTHVT